MTVSALTVFAIGCSSQPEKVKEATAAKKAEVKKESEFESGRAAFQRMYVSARTWAPDAQPVRLESRPHSQDPGDGKAGIWSAVFVSAGKQAVRNYQWSGIVAEGSTETGVSPGSSDYWSPANASTRPFDQNYLKTDSDKALEIALKKGGEALVKKDPKQPVKYMLFFDAGKSRLLWRVSFGNSQNDAKLNVLVSASNGEFVSKEK
ncbi:MAG TPA: hypothetical protein VM056_00965 [Terriglobales bacterium]|nr:hypothetical protein [Terriglobales bacterium]